MKPFLRSVATAMEALKEESIDVVKFDGVWVEPTDVSIKKAIAFATDGNFDGYLADGMVRQQRLNNMWPRVTTRDDSTALFRDSMRCW